MKIQVISKHLYIFYSIVFLLYIVNVFVESNQLSYLLGILAMMMLFISFFGASKLFKILGSTFFIIGGTLFYSTGQSLTILPTYFVSNIPLLALLAMLPWMNSAVRSGRFDRSLSELIKVNVSDLGKLYPRSSITTLILGAFLNLPATTISQDVLKTILSTLNKNIRDSFVSTATLRGYSLALLWSPLEIMVALAIFTTGVEYVILLPFLIFICVISFLLDAIWGRVYYKKYSYGTDTAKKHHNNMENLMKRIFHFVLSLILFLTLVIVFGNLFQLDFILTVTLLIFPYALIWSLFMKRGSSFWIIGWNTWKTKTNNMRDFIVLFLSLSLFSNSLSNTSFLQIIEKPLFFVSDYPIILLFLIQAVFVFLSMFGIHPIATAGILSGFIPTLLEIYNPVSVALILITGPVATFPVGTYGLLVTLTSVSLNKSPHKITLYNLPYSLLVMIVGTFTAYFLL